MCQRAAVKQEAEPAPQLICRGRKFMQAGKSVACLALPTRAHVPNLTGNTYCDKGKVPLNLNMTDPGAIGQNLRRLLVRAAPKAEHLSYHLGAKLASASCSTGRLACHCGAGVDQ